MNRIALRRVGLHRVVLPLARPLGTAHGVIAAREALVVGLEDAEGHLAFGEATPLPEFGTETLAESRDALRSVLGAALREGLPADPLAPERDARLPSCAAFAWSTARIDLAGRREDRSLAGILHDRSGRSGEPLSSVASQVLVGGDSPEEVARAARESAQRGASAFKLKLAVSSSERDLGLDVERVAALRASVGEAARLRLDANEAWSEPQAERALTALAGFGVDFVEQPVARENVAALARLAGGGPVAVAADEALLNDGWRACLETEALSIFVLKPGALGSLSLAIDLARRVGEAAGRVVWTTLIDGAIARAATRSLAAATADPEEVHGLGTASLLSADLALDTDPMRGGSIGVPSGAGLGVAPDEAVLRRAESLFEATA